MSDATERVEELRNANKRPSPEDTQRYNDLERDIKKAELYESFIDHPVTKEIVERLVAWISEWNQKLMKGDGDKYMVERRDNLIDILSIFSPMKARTDHLTKDIPEQVKQFQEYYKGYPGQ